ncbi:hypothetical protein C5C42_16485 [Rathayibacter sp. AY1F7]|nr:hypothetical protein C5C25_06170 [Rathayibacter sp. AY2B9]PPG60973.1 hypothetical protein C5C57_02495 [Rathayibacter sp. AY1C5]PPH21502.1 hypothetical protein C5C99_06165 [Rathayibacter sp. AY1C4]PPH41476.1 hypothetical protein C5C42_16485 [Rathayibacter sp. AY1F7]PPH74561.1 hypothetical protein C5C90_10745 [Rathayibacter sp. AY1D4]PPH80217.1 hypothetical protein C5C50_11075 [Rathayibacter sp. AY1D9]PPH85531.1 hypothetical protein C5C64_16190 [Rathayibacter sp. AY1D3]
MAHPAPVTMRFTGIRCVLAQPSKAGPARWAGKPVTLYTRGNGREGARWQLRPILPRRSRTQAWRVSQSAPSPSPDRSSPCRCCTPDTPVWPRSSSCRSSPLRSC